MTVHAPGVDEIRSLAERASGFRLGSAEILREHQQIPTVIRYEVADGLAPGVVVRRPGPWAPYQPDHAGGSAWGLLNEWAGLAFLAELDADPPLAPLF